MWREPVQGVFINKKDVLLIWVFYPAQAVCKREYGCAYTLARVLDPEIDCDLNLPQTFYLSAITGIDGVVGESERDG
jgi:hypothetical protein